MKILNYNAYQWCKSQVDYQASLNELYIIHMDKTL